MQGTHCVAFKIALIRIVVFKKYHQRITFQYFIILKNMIPTRLFINGHCSNTTFRSVLRLPFVKNNRLTSGELLSIDHGASHRRGAPGGCWGGGGGSLTSKNRPSHHKYKSPKKFLFCVSHTWSLVSRKALRSLKAGRYPFLRAKGQMGGTKNGSSEKSHKKTGRTIIIAKNFV